MVFFELRPAFRAEVDGIGALESAVRAFHDFLISPIGAIQLLQLAYCGLRGECSVTF